jgi:hypothetical protein
VTKQSVSYGILWISEQREKMPLHSNNHFVFKCEMGMVYENEEVNI